MLAIVRRELGVMALAAALVIVGLALRAAFGHRRAGTDRAVRTVPRSTCAAVEHERLALAVVHRDHGADRRSCGRRPGRSSRRSQTSQASASSSTGTPWPVWSRPRRTSRSAGRLEANRRESSPWSARRMLTAKRRRSRDDGSVRDVLSKHTSSSSGSSESDVTALVVMPAGPSEPLAVTTATPVGKWPMTSR